MRLLLLPAQVGKTETWSVRDARRHIARATAARVARLLSEGANRNGAPIKAAEIAILVRTKSDIPEVQMALTEVGVASVAMSESCVLESVEADHVADCLRAWLEPSNLRRLHTALASPLFEFKVGQLFTLRENEEALNNALGRMATAAELWRTKGFGAAFRSILMEYETMPRLAGEVGGERALTNYLHIAEILNRVERERKLTPSALLRWLESPTLSGFAENEAASLRLESEERGVRILTMHKAKGLEFDVCFVLSGWSDPEKRRNDRQFFSERTELDEHGNLRRVVDARYCAVRAAEESRLSEEKRLLYVSLTRARTLCFLAVPAVETVSYTHLTLPTKA
jgi:exodeoxyribonuclease V beta subunit